MSQRAHLRAHHGCLDAGMPYSSHTHPQPSTDASSSSTSLTISPRDPFLSYPSSASFSGRSYVMSNPSEASSGTFTHSMGGSSSVCSLGEWGSDDICEASGGATQSFQAMGYDWSTMGEAALSNFDTAFASGGIGGSLWPETCGEVSSSWSLVSHHDTTLLPYLQHWNDLFPIPEGSAKEFSSYLQLPSLQEENVHHFDYDSAKLYRMPLQHSEGETSSFWTDHHDSQGIMGKILGMTESSGVCKNTGVPLEAAREAEIYQMKEISQRCSGTSNTRDTALRPVCPRCAKFFVHNADLTRHMRTQHGGAGRGYRCAFKGCSKINKIWSRLDSFKTHVKNQHKIRIAAEINSIVEKSATGSHDFPIVIRSLSSIHGGPPASRTHDSIKL